MPKKKTRKKYNERVNFTFSYLQNLKCKDQPNNSNKTLLSSYYEIYWDIVDGLGVKVTFSGALSWVYRYFDPEKGKKGANVRRVYARVNLSAEDDIEEQRAFARKMNRWVDEGWDPWEELNQERNLTEKEKVQRQTLREICTEYRAYRMEGGRSLEPVSEATHKRWLCHINTHITISFGQSEEKSIADMPYSEIGLALADEWFESMRHTPASANSVRSFLMLVHRFAAKKGLAKIEANIWGAIEKYKEKGHKPRFDENTDEPARFCQYLRDAMEGKVLDGDYNLISPFWIGCQWILYYTGARPDEVKRIELEEIYLDAGQYGAIRIPKHKVSKKTKQDKWLYLDKWSRDILDWILEKRATHLNPVFQESKYLLPGPGKSGHLADHQGKQWDNMQKYLGLKEATPYSLRRHYASTGMDADEAGDVGDTQIAMQHATRQQTEHYAGETKKSLERRHNIISFKHAKIATELNKKASS